MTEAGLAYWLAPFLRVNSFPRVCQAFIFSIYSFTFLCNIFQIDSYTNHQPEVAILTMMIAIIRQYDTHVYMQRPR